MDLEFESAAEKDENYFNNEKIEQFAETDINEGNEIDLFLNTEDEIIKNFSTDQNNKTINEINDYSDESENFVTKDIDKYYEYVIQNEYQKIDNSNYDQKMKDLVEEFDNLNIYDPKIDVIFKSIFGKPNEVIAKSLINSVLVHEDEIETLTFNDTEFFSKPVDRNRKTVIVDLYLKNDTKQRSYLIEMQIHEKYDMLLRAEFSIYRLVDHLMEPGSIFRIEEKIYSINFIYYNMFITSKFYHRLNTLENNDPEKVNETIENTKKIKPKDKVENNSEQNETNGLQLKKNNYHEKEIIVIELRKFRRLLNKNTIGKLVEYSNEIEEMKKSIEEMKKNIEDKEKNTEITEDKKEIEKMKNIVNKKERKLKLYLWLAFLSKVNTVYNPNPDWKHVTETKVKNKIIKIRNEISFELYNLFKKYDEIMKAIEICKAPLGDEKKKEFIEYISKAEEFFYKNKQLVSENKQLVSENKRQKIELEEKDLENKRQKIELEEKDLELEKKDLELEKKGFRIGKI